MPHMVIYRSADGKPAYHQADALEEAVRFVEHMRNHEKVGEARIFAMREIPIEVRTYYRVEVAGADAPSEAEAPRAEAAPVTATVAPALTVSSARGPLPPEAPKPEPAAVAPGNGSGRFGLFGKS